MGSIVVTDGSGKAGQAGADCFAAADTPMPTPRAALMATYCPAVPVSETLGRLGYAPRHTWR